MNEVDSFTSSITSSFLNDSYWSIAQTNISFKNS